MGVCQSHNVWELKKPELMRPLLFISASLGTRRKIYTVLIRTNLFLLLYLTIHSVRETKLSFTPIISLLAQSSFAVATTSPGG